MIGHKPQEHSPRRGWGRQEVGRRWVQRQSRPERAGTPLGRSTARPAHLKTARRDSGNL